MRIVKRISLFAGMCLGVLAFGAAMSHLRPTPQAAYEGFCSEDVPEALLMDPLIMCGRRVVPIVLANIRDSGMPKRIYAIGFLGNGRYREALPALREVLNRGYEDEQVRRCALESIWMIDDQEGARTSKDFLGRSDLLGETAREIQCARHSPRRRTYWDALMMLQ